MYWQVRDWLNGSKEGARQKKTTTKAKPKQKANTKKLMLKSGKSISKQPTQRSTSKTSSSGARTQSPRTVQSKKERISSAPPTGHIKSSGGSFKREVKTDASLDESACLLKVKASSVDSLKKVGGGKGKSKYPVRLNVYSLVEVNEKIKYTGIGIYHSGTEVHGCEWAYGGHPFEGSGIYLMKKPRDLKSLSDIDGSFIFKETLLIGFTDLILEEVKKILAELEKTWKGRQYHLLYKNCNNFSDTFCTKLCGRGIPEWINRGANMMSYFPFVVEMIPKEYLTPQALKNQIKKGIKGKLSKEERKGVQKVQPKMPPKTVPKIISKAKEEVSISKALIQTGKSFASQKSNPSLLKVAPLQKAASVVVAAGKSKPLSKSGGGEAVKVVTDERTGSSIDVPLNEVEQFKLLLKGELKMDKMKMNVEVPGDQVSDDLSASSEVAVATPAEEKAAAATADTVDSVAPDNNHEEKGGS